MTKRRIAIVGLPMYAKKLAEDLNTFKGEKWCYHFDTYYNRKDRLKLLLTIKKYDLIFSINGTLQTSRLFDLAHKKNVPVLMLWAGSDVMYATDAFHKHPENYRKEYIDRHFHAAVSPQLSAELAEIGINAKFTIYQNFSVKSQSSEPFETLKVLIRIAKNREDFYGLDRTVSIAKELPDIGFTVVGTENVPKDAPENMTFLGWMDNMPALFDSHAIALRLPVHDGLSPFVLEALANGCHVCYNQKLDHCEYTTSNEQVISFLNAMKKKLAETGKIERNIEGQTFIQSNFEFKHVNSNLEKLIEQVITAFNG